ncbi:hypothetical protein CEW88_24185 (plasmid) [Alloyangia pacifica]|uniref:Aminomethyltransferase C-terminal domain-containing protein n=1 Tax=Alloyangia pacifica TaxID=311180 RepID=A0A2U8HM82_9RHOB|nr:glycine cleavage T C-terminal barrel domain-containing protein [Alloyangia pacifica]AWI86863.1 hypothetical protein CEW88_24185 [Alloyangia pacifica]
MADPFPSHAAPLGKIAGHTSSCTFGFRIGKPVALGHAYHAVADGTRVQVDIARTLYDATAVEGPLFDPEGNRMKV